MTELLHTLVTHMASYSCKKFFLRSKA